MAPSRSQNSKESGNPEAHSGQRFIDKLKGAKSVNEVDSYYVGKLLATPDKQGSRSN
jgi:hypothetical protein